MNSDHQINPEALAATRSLHPFNLAALQEQFSHVPVTVIDHDEPFPQSLRLIVSSHCEQQCQYPEEGVLWCHNEGIARDGLSAPQLDSLLAVARFFLEQFGIRRVKIGGLEPVLGQRLFGLITSLRQLGIDEVSFTTHGLRVNGRLKELQVAGLTRLTISIQHFERENYRRLTGRDGLAEALALVQEAREVGLSPVKINRVLLKNYTHDLPAFIDWLQTEDLTARLFDLMWQPQHDSYYLKYLVSWQDFLPLWAGQTEQVVVKRYRTSWRTRVLFKLRSGGGIEANLLQPKWRGDSPVCQSCRLAEVCAEGYLGCGVRITPDLHLSPCILRDDLATDLRPALDSAYPAEHVQFIGHMLQGAATELVGQPIPLLTGHDVRPYIIKAKPVTRG
ncbi:MAG: radical SAM protein [Chloroflexota bacterium]